VASAGQIPTRRRLSGTRSRTLPIPKPRDGAICSSDDTAKPIRTECCCVSSSTSWVDAGRVRAGAQWPGQRCGSEAPSVPGFYAAVDWL
jgi:hypothetical protein